MKAHLSSFLPLKGGGRSAGATGLFFLTSVLSALATSAVAVEGHDWYVLKTADGAYAFDKNEITTEDNGVRSVWLYQGTREGADQLGYFVDCRTDRAVFIGAFLTVNGQEQWIMTEGSSNPYSLGWRPIEKDRTLQLAAHIACDTLIAGARYVDSQQDAIERLKALSN